MFQDANVAGRNYVTDDRWGGFISTKWTPTNDIKITTNYVHTDLSGLPDFGVPWYRQGNTPVTEVTASRARTGTASSIATSRPRGRISAR